MVTITSSVSSFISGPLFRIKGTAVTATGKVDDSGLRVTLMATQFHLIFYFMKYFLPNTKHSFKGIANISSYIPTGSKKSFIDARVQLSRIRNVIFSDTESENSGELSPLFESTDYHGKKVLKLKFVVYKFLFENWNDREVVDTRYSSKDAVGDVLMELYNTLAAAQKIPPNFPPLNRRQVDLPPEFFSGLRPGAERPVMTEYVVNQDVSMTLLSHEFCKIKALTQDSNIIPDNFYLTSVVLLERRALQDQHMANT